MVHGYSIFYIYAGGGWFFLSGEEIGFAILTCGCRGRWFVEAHLWVPFLTLFMVPWDRPLGLCASLFIYLSLRFLFPFSHSNFFMILSLINIKLRFILKLKFS